MVSDQPGIGRNPPHPVRKLIVVGSSSGGLNALVRLFDSLPARIPAAVMIVQHMSPHFDSRLSEILARSSKMKIQQARAGVSILEGNVYIAPPDQHLVINESGVLGLNSDAKVNYTRPAVDTLFISAAENFGERVIAVVLTGYGKDGTIGCEAVARAGGIVIAQDEASSAQYGMPGSAADGGYVDFILPLAEIAPKILSLLE